MVIMGSLVFDVIYFMVKYNILVVFIIDKDNRVLNLFEVVDVIFCIKGGVYDELSVMVGEVLFRWVEEFGGIYMCNEDDWLDVIFDIIWKLRVYWLIVVDDDNCFKGIILLLDILKYVLFYGEEDDDIWGN